MSNFAAASLAATNDAVGGMSRVWTDGANVASMTNHLAGFAASQFANLNMQGSLAQAGANDLGTGPIGSLDSSFWNFELRDRATKPIRLTSTRWTMPGLLPWQG